VCVCVGITIGDKVFATVCPSGNMDIIKQITSRIGSKCHK
jgi:hypothetical protein